MNSRKSMDARAASIMLVLCMIWALQQIAIKAAGADFAPVFQIAVRTVVGSILVSLFMFWRGQRWVDLQASWRAGVLCGVLFGVEFIFLGESLRHTTAGHVVVLLYTAPIFAALGLHLRLPEERLNFIQWLGIAIAFGGVALAFLWRDAASATPEAGGNMLWGDFMALLAGAAWGATTVVVRATRLAVLPPAQTLMYQLLAGAVLLLAAVWLSGQTEFRMTPMVWTSLIFQSIFVAFVSYLTWFWLLSKYLASRLGVFSFMTPLFGVALGAWLLHEPVGPGFLGGTLLVVAGVVVLSSHAGIRSALQRKR